MTAVPTATISSSAASALPVLTTPVPSRATRFGSRPGQFNGVAAIAMDPNDVLYVADTGNQRVQRFTPKGLFAGEARSQSTCPGCSGFVLGDFGSPGNIAVNSNNFYILDKSTELVHVFETSVIHSIDDKSAWVEYQSKPNYVGPDSLHLPRHRRLPQRLMAN